MRKAITFSLAAILMFVGTVAGTLFYLEHSVTPYSFIYLQQFADYREKYKAWFQACDYSPYPCLGIGVPAVVQKWMPYSLLGYYDGSGTVFVNRRLKGQRLNAVLMHEMVHYLQVQAGGLEVPGYAKPICRAEEEAFGIVDEWLIDHSYADLIRGDEWWRPYSHCWEWYKPNAVADDPDGEIWMTGPQ